MGQDHMGSAEEGTENDAEASCPGSLYIACTLF